MHEIICKLLEEMGFYIEKTGTKEDIIKANEEKIREITAAGEKQNEEQLYNNICFAIDQRKANYYMLDFNKYDSQNIEEKILYNQKKYYSYLKRKDDNNLLIKNSSLIIFIEVKNKQEEDELKKLALKLEDDRYYFKKYVVLYSDEELQSLITNMGQAQISGYIREKILDKNQFQQYKIGEKNNDYSLILKLLIKIPVLSLLNEEKIVFKNLKTIIEEELLKANLKEFTDKVLNIDMNNMEESIENFIGDIGVE